MYIYRKFLFRNCRYANNTKSFRYMRECKERNRKVPHLSEQY